MSISDNKPESDDDRSSMQANRNIIMRLLYTSNGFDFSRFLRDNCERISNERFPRSQNGETKRNCEGNRQHDSRHQWRHYSYKQSIYNDGITIVAIVTVKNHKLRHPSRISSRPNVSWRPRLEMPLFESLNLPNWTTTILPMHPWGSALRLSQHCVLPRRRQPGTSTVN